MEVLVTPTKQKGLEVEVEAAYIAISNGAISRTANGGSNGVTNSAGLTEFPANGATAGGVGLPNETISNFFLTTKMTQFVVEAQLL